MLHLCAVLINLRKCGSGYVCHIKRFVHCAEVCVTICELCNHLTLCAPLFPFLSMLHLCAVLINLDVPVTTVNIRATFHTTQKYAQPLDHLSQWVYVLLTGDEGEGVMG